MPGTHGPERMRVENYFTEQPSGRNLLHVHHSQHLSDAEAAAAAAAEAAAQVLPPRIGRYVEAPSGRSLLRGSTAPDDDSVTARPGGRYAETEYSTGTSDGMDSSRWGDSDAASHRHASHLIRSTSAVQSNESTGVSATASSPGRAAAVAAAAAAAAGTAAGAAAAAEPPGREGSFPVVRRGMMSPMTPGSEAASRHRSSFRTTDSGRSISALPPQIPAGPGGRSGHGANASEGGEARRELRAQASSSSSGFSRIRGPRSETSESPRLIGQESWRSSGAPETERLYSADSMSSDPSPAPGGAEAARVDDEGTGDRDLGDAWLASRHHARRFDEER